jgi:hypothetical protein
LEAGVTARFSFGDLKQPVCRDLAQATTPSIWLRITTATSFMGSTLERRTLVHHCASMVETTLICLLSRMLRSYSPIQLGARGALGGESYDGRVEIYGLLAGKFTSVLEQGPAQALESGVGFLFAAAHLIEGLAGVSDDVEFVEGDFGIGQMVADAFDEGRRHLDGSGRDVVEVGLVGAQLLGEAGDGQSIAPFRDEHDLASVGVGSEGEIGVAAPIQGLVNGHAGGGALAAQLNCASPV